MAEGVITSIEVQKRNKERANIYIDGQFAFALSLIEAAGLRKGQQLSAQQIDKLKQEDAVIKAVDRALRFLSYRPRSIQEVQRNLAAKDIPPDVVDSAVQRLCSMGYLDDHAFARYWVENRSSFKPLGPGALRHELRTKGVDPDIISEVLETELDTDAAAYAAASRQAPRLRGLSRRDFRQKLGNFLQRRGFNYGTARAALDRVMSEMDEQFFVESEP